MPDTRAGLHDAAPAVSPSDPLDELATRFERTHETMQRHVARSVDATLVARNWLFGWYLEEFERGGASRAEVYGRGVMEGLASRLKARGLKGCSMRNLFKFRQFYLDHPQIVLAPSAPPTEIVPTLSAECSAHPETADNAALTLPGGTGSLTRVQLASLLKNPLVLEFLGLEERPHYTEDELDSAIIDQLETFLLELGKGFLFEARQKRFTFDNDHYRIDLVFYNRLLRCYVLIDLKRGKLTHQDLGQMQMYVNYYDRHVKLDEELPTVGIVLCHEKSDAMVELTLPRESNIFASKYLLYLPSREVLKARLEEITRGLEGGVGHG